MKIHTFPEYSESSEAAMRDGIFIAMTSTQPSKPQRGDIYNAFSLENSLKLTPI
jgi:hypothetical protein